jgi:hypothetical protein
MNMQQELVMPFDAANARTLLIFTPFYFGLAVILFLTIRLLIIPKLSLYFFYDFLISNIVIGFFILCMYISEFLCGFLVIMLGYMYFDVTNDMRNKLSVAILNTQGIITHRHGVIAWKDVQDFALLKGVPPGNGRAMGIGIKIKKDSLSMIHKQSSYAGKLVLFWAKCFGTEYQIPLLSSSFPMKDIISFVYSIDGPVTKKSAADAKIKDIPVKVEAFEQFARAAALWGFSLPTP